MILWAVLTIMVTAAALFVAAPFLTASRDASRVAAGSASAFRDQLAEIDRELADGTIDAAAADAAKSDIRRRVIARGMEDAPTRTLALVERKFFAYAVAGVIAVGGTILYALSGNPDIPSAPRSGTAALPVPATGAPTAPSTTAGAASVPTAPAGVPQAGGLATVDDMIDRLAQRLAKVPGDADGWRMLGWSYFRTDRYQEAANAYGRASALQPSVAPLKTAWAEALIRANDGKVGEEALRLVTDALKLDPKDARSRYFVGLAKEQGGDAKGALDAWLALLADATAADEWEGEVRHQTVELAKASGIDISARMPASPGGPGILGKLNQERQPAVTAAPRGPSEADMKAAATLSPAERDAMIRSMVDGLQAKLDANPRDADGWIRLIRSRGVLGDTAKAKAAVERAQQVFSDSADDRERIVAAAKEAGLLP